MENGKEVAVMEKSALVPMQFNESQVDLIKTTVAKGTTNDQLALFLYTCKKTGLDPLAKQIHCIVRQTKNGPQMSIQTAIDGYRLVADRSGKYAGNDDPIYDDEANPTKATVTVYKIVSGVRCPFTATARWSQYFPGEAQGFMWRKMPHLMLGKCAEALALRKAFPAELSGIYTNEEMQQAESVETHIRNVEPAKPHTPVQRKSETTPGPDGVKTATGFIIDRKAPNKGGFCEYAIEGFIKENGKPMFFSTRDPLIIETLDERRAGGEKVSLEYKENENPAFAAAIVGLVMVKEEVGDAQPGD